MTCVLLMTERIYGHYGMDPGIPNEAALHRCLLSDIPFVSVERQQHLSLFMKNYQSPFENMFIFPWFPTVQLAGAWCCFPVAADVFSPFRTQRLVTMSYMFVSFAQNSGRVFFCL